MSETDSIRKQEKKAALRKKETAQPASSKASSYAASRGSTITSRKDRLGARKKEIFYPVLNNLKELKKNLEKNFSWCLQFSHDETLSKDEKISLFEVTLLINQSIKHMDILQDALDECKESSPSWEDLFEVMAEHFREYEQDYVQFVSSLEDLQETVRSLKRHDSMMTWFNDSTWLGKEKYTFDTVLTYPRDRIIKFQNLLEESKIILSIVEGSSTNDSDRAELNSCNQALSLIKKILATDSSLRVDPEKTSNEIVKAEERLPLCKVLFSYRPGQDDELRIRENDIIEIISKSRNGWWQGRSRNKVGWFPANYVTEMEVSDSDSGSTDSTEKADSSDNESKAPSQDSMSKQSQMSSSNISSDSNADQLSRLQRELTSAEEARAEAEARVQELKRAKEDAEARAEQLKKVLQSSKVKERRQSNSSSSDGGDKGSDEDGQSEEVTSEEYDVDLAEMKRSMKELDEIASISSSDKNSKKQSNTTDKDVSYHDVECYSCKNIIQSYIPKNGESYCASCYEDIFVKKCFKCKKPITGAGLTYKEKPMHPRCFTCAHCEVSIEGEKFITREDKPYCADCFGELFAKRCTSCSKPIIGENGTSFITSAGRSWHNECFVCTTCKSTLIGKGFFFSNDNDISCPGCGKR